MWCGCWSPIGRTSPRETIIGERTSSAHASGFVAPSGRCRRRVRSGSLILIADWIVGWTLGRRSCNGAAHTVASQVRSACIGRARSCTATPGALGNADGRTDWGGCCRSTPRELAKDKGAFDAAVKVRRTAADRSAHALPSGTTHGALALQAAQTDEPVKPRAADRRQASRRRVPRATRRSVQWRRSHGQERVRRGRQGASAAGAAVDRATFRCAPRGLCLLAGFQVQSGRRRRRSGRGAVPRGPRGHRGFGEAIPAGVPE